VRRLDDREDLPPNLRDRLDDQIEVAPGIKKRLGDCVSLDEAVGWLEAANEAAMNHREITELSQRADAAGIVISDGLHERIVALKRGDGPALIAVRDELRVLIAESGL